MYGVSTKSLKDFLTSEREQLRQITKMPSNEFRLWEVDIVPEERKSIAGDGSSESVEIDDDFFDDFVIVEKIDMKKKNVAEKLMEEAKIKDSGSSKCLISNSVLVGNNAVTYTLEDFQIKKVIDKGSFGKVFLVVNKHNG